jgi:subtilisin family serine protease
MENRTMRLAPLSLAAFLLAAASAPVSAQTYYDWMSPEIKDAWAQGYKGQGTTITVIDDFRSNYGYYGNLGDGRRLLRHGEWTFKEIGMLAPSAIMKQDDFSTAQQVRLYKGLNVLNMSYGMYAQGSYSLNQIGWGAQESSIISYAKNGQAVAVKAAGNDSVAVGGVNGAGNKDFLNLALVGAQSVIFAGALDRNGTDTNKANLASYSNFAGSDTNVQKNFLVVGVRGDLTGLYGTSFAAPVITGYASVLGSKFTKATPTSITNQLLNTARQDTINGYNIAIHGRGEASLTRALAPVSIR